MANIFPAVLPRINTTEEFTRVGVTAAADISQGVRHKLQVPLELHRRSIWIAAGSPFQTHPDAEWYLRGRLCFYRTGVELGHFPITGSSDQRPAVSDNNLVFQFGASGSRQPTLRFPSTDYNASNYEQFLEIPCFEFVVEASEVVYEVHQFFLGVIPSGTVTIMTGLRVLSQVR